MLFLALQIFAIDQIIRSQSFQKSTFIKTTSKWVGWYWKQKSEAKEYLSLKEQNRILQQENAVLRNVHQSGLVKECPESGELRDSLLKQVYTYLEARVVHNSIHMRNNNLIINKGSVHGIKNGMGIISPEGVVGIVKEVGDRYSLAISVLHKNFNIVARPKNSNHFGTLSWNGNNYRYAQVLNMPKQTPIKHGDTLVTDLKSSIFPEGIPVGNVKSYKINPEVDFFDVQIELAVDFSKLNEVYVVDNLHKEKLEELKSKIRP